MRVGGWVELYPNFFGFVEFFNFAKPLIPHIYRTSILKSFTAKPQDFLDRLLLPVTLHHYDGLTTRSVGLHFPFSSTGIFPSYDTPLHFFQFPHAAPTLSYLPIHTSLPTDMYFNSCKLLDDSAQITILFTTYPHVYI